MPKPDYADGSIVNLMSSVAQAAGGGHNLYEPLPALNPEALAEAENIVLVVIDGLGYEYLVRQGAGSVLHDNLLARLTSVFPSTTASAITSFLTGTAPQQHALTGWFMYLKELGAVTVPLPFRPRFGDVSLERMGLDARRIFDSPSIFDKLHKPSYMVLPNYIRDSAYTVVHAGCAQRLGYASLESCFSSATQILGQPGGGKYLYVYWSELDELGHTHGIGSGQVSDHFAELDAVFNKFLESIKGSSTFVIVTADHGFIDTSLERRIKLEEHPRLAATLALPFCGEQRAAYCYVKPGQTETFLEYFAAHFAECATVVPSSQLVEEGFFGLGNSHPRLLDRIGDYTVLMKDNWVIGDKLLGENEKEHRGVHGGTSNAEMYVPLIAVQA